MKTKLLAILLVVCALTFARLQAQDLCKPVGWATQNGGTTGGGSAAATVVTTYAALKTALTTASVKVVHIQGTITFPSAGRINIQDQSGKTIIGLSGARLKSVDLTASGSGIFYVKRCSNIIFRNIIFEGPGAYDTDGNDNMTIDNCTNVWVDHCEFHDGMDGNLDIKNAADYISVTWCTFSYEKAPIAGGSGGADDHRYSNLFGSSDGATGDRGKLRITMQYCWWGAGCRERMPRIRFGKVHMANNLFTSSVSNHCIRAGFEADILAEGNYFQNQAKPIDLFENDFTAVKGVNNFGAANVSVRTAFTPPYTLAVASASSIVAPIQSCAGAKLPNPTSCSSCGGTTPINTPPTVSITAPVNNASFTAPASITIAATAADANGTVSNVQFYNGSTLLGSDASSPYSFSWSNVAAGTYTLTAKATDDAGAVTTSSAITVVVTGTTNNIPPTVSITAPANNASFIAPASITIAATAADANGTVSNVQFYNGSTLLGSDASSPYSFSWSNVAAGTYTLTAKATDNAGAVTTSSAITIVVSSASTTSGIVGPDCGSSNQTISLELSSNLLINATASSWWYTGSAGGIAPVAGTLNKAVLTTGNGFGAGEVCVGVNYNVAPWWKQYCKKINLCGAKEGDWVEVTVTTNNLVYPNPTEESFRLSSFEGIESVSIFNMLGNEVLKISDLSQDFGKDLGADTYVLQVHYNSGRKEMIRLIKLK